jgi:hypothetical protein
MDDGGGNEEKRNLTKVIEGTEGERKRENGSSVSDGRRI